MAARTRQAIEDVLAAQPPAGAAPLHPEDHLREGLFVAAGVDPQTERDRSA